MESNLTFMNREVASKQFPVLFSIYHPLSVSTLFYYLPFVFKTTYNILQYIQDIFKTFIINEFQGIRYIGEPCLSYSTVTPNRRSIVFIISLNVAS